MYRREEIGKCKFYVTFNKVQMKTGHSHKSVLMLLFGRQEEWITKTVFMLPCLTVCVGVLVTVSGQRMARCSGLTSPTEVS